MKIERYAKYVALYHLISLQNENVFYKNIIDICKKIAITMEEIKIRNIYYMVM